MPIIEPEMDIHAPNKAEAEQLLLKDLTGHIDALPEGREVMLKLTIPTVDGLYSGLIAHPRVARVVALSGGYSREEDMALSTALKPLHFVRFSRM